MSPLHPNINKAESFPDAATMLRYIREKKEAYWHRERERRPLELFHKAARYVPAYKDFLKKNGIRHPEKIRTFKDFQNVPPTSKKSYLRQYPLEKLCWDGSLQKPLVFTSTSGSTGEPFYFARSYSIDWQAAITHELFFANSHESVQGPTLVVICFSMGVWIGGLITYQSFEIMRERGYPISIIAPGINKQEIFNALKKIAPLFAQTILIGYAPFLKDIIDEAPSRGINVKPLHLRLIFAAEAFTEKFREYLAKKAGIENDMLDTMNIYGTADIGAIAFESPLSILMRQITMRKPRLFAEIFHHIQRTPTLAQYIPSFITFEEQQNELLVTGNNAVPLIRYAIGDHGGTFSVSDAVERFGNHATNIFKEARAKGIQKFFYHLPFVYVYERIDLATTLYGLQIYPETIREVLIENPMHRVLTGKITLITKFDRKQDQYLEINLELRKGKKVSVAMRKIILAQIVSNLRLKNSEFRELHNFLGNRALPKLVFWSAEHPLHFKPGIKQKWVKK